MGCWFTPSHKGGPSPAKRGKPPPVHVSHPTLDYALPRHAHRSSKPGPWSPGRRTRVCCRARIPPSLAGAIRAVRRGRGDVQAEGELADLVHRPAVRLVGCRARGVAACSRYTEPIDTVACKDAEGYSRIASGEKANAVPFTLFRVRVRVRTLLGDGIEDSVRVNDLRVQKGRR